MASTDYLRLNEHKIFKELCESLPKNITKTLNLVTVHDSILFTWDFQNNCVLSLNIKAARSREGDNVIHQKLLPLHPPLFSPEFLLVNDTGTLLAVVGPCGVLMLQLPTRCPPYGAFDNNKEVVYCKTHSLDERLLSCSDTIEVRQAKFHPGSVNHNHFLVLTNDNMLRLYQIENNEAHNISIHSVGEKPTGLFPGSKTTFLDIYGEIAVDFDFGLPEVSQSPQYFDVAREKSLIKSFNKNKDETYMINVQTQTGNKIVPKSHVEKEQNGKEWHNLIWPVYILTGNMSVFSLNIDLKKRWKPMLKGPLPMSSFESEQGEACSLICLNTVPEIICIAMSNGILCHSILLDLEEETYEELKQNSKSISNIPNKELIAFESVELEMGLVTTGDDSSLKYKCQIFLHKDESKTDRYYATHAAGIHSVSISCIDDLQNFVQGPEELDPTSDIFVRPTKAEYTVCTKTATSQKVNPVIGFGLYYEPTAIITLLADGSLVTLGVLYAADLPKISDTDDYCDGARQASPLKKMLQEPFDAYIQKILKKTPTQPVLKLPSSGEHTQEQCYELLQRAAQVFREEYFKNHIKAREELEKRVHTLSLMKRNQLKEIEIMNEEREILQEKASNLAEKYEDIKDKQDELLKRCENLLMLVSRKRSEPSDSERDFLNELQEVNEKILVYRNKIDKIKNKMKYQEIQIENWKAQEVKKVAAINETHTNTIRTNLQETGTKITDMVQQVKEFKSSLNLK
ncbi:nuclear pore complex protein Nup88 [Leptinotarsa decemlineata]|uniref:nuclear pore complex protein Nup88 n=1 Tax=Leptinotarsa decemlineata TaxID=7539 RepID=UPI003D30B7CE